MRILHVVPTYLPATRYGGPIHSVHGLCKALAAQGHEVQVYTTNVDGPGVFAAPLGQPVAMDGVNVTYFPTGWPRRIYRSPRMGRQLKRTIENFDLLHIHSVFLWPGLAASRAARRNNVPYIVSPRGMLVPELIAHRSRWAKTAWLRAFDRPMLAGAAAIHLTSEREAQDLQALGIEPRRVVLVPNGVDAPTFTSNIRRAERRVLFLGRLDRKKSLEVLLQAMAESLRAELVIVGSGEARYVAELKTLVRRLELDSRVRFVGHLENEEKWRQYREAAVFVLPSVSENFGNSVLEAMTAGCPVIVSPGVGLSDTVQRWECGLVVPREPEQLSRAITELLGQPELREKMAARAVEAAQSFLWPEIAARMSRAYSELTDLKGETI